MSQVGQRQRVSLPVDNDRKFRHLSGLIVQGNSGLAERGTFIAVEALLLWRDPAKTGGVFAGITLLYLLLEWSRFSLLTLIANVLLFLVVLTFLWNNLAQFINKPGVPIPAILQHGISDSQSKSYAQDLTSGINQLLGFTRRLILGKEVVLTVQVGPVSAGLCLLSAFELAVFCTMTTQVQWVWLITQVAVVLYIVAKIGNYFSTLGLGYTGQYDSGLVSRLL
ncbi:TPA: hypothetical protein ACH3X3_008263 [Trebouxia sp. C0006]